MEFINTDTFEAYSKITKDITSLKVLQNIIDLSEMEENMKNFEFTANWDNETQTDVFNLTKMMQEYQQNYAYNFDHINYAIIAAISEGQFKAREKMLKFQLESEYNKVGIVVDLVNMYNDLSTDFEII